MNNKEHLAWIHQRLEHVHGENPHVDYMLRLQQIIDSMEVAKEEDEKSGGDTA